MRMLGSFMGMEVIESPAMLISIHPKEPRTGDMRQMIDDLQVNGVVPQTRKVPGWVIYGTKIITHPTVYARMHEAMKGQT